MRPNQPTATLFPEQVASARISHFRTGPVTLGPLSTLIEAGRTSGLYSRLLPGVPQRSKPQGEQPSLRYADLQVFAAQFGPK
jgi:hypothetical protein